MTTVDWSAWRRQEPAPGAEGLRERKKRLLRQRLSDTATEMFLERGFDAVRVSEIARACDVSEKTVFNHFPTKESLILDRGRPRAPRCAPDWPRLTAPPSRRRWRSSPRNCAP